ncbi:hypothetical protein GGU10DRAFT_361384 [Lentinula aff. detonsa]|uniref:Uncharacterized protein n=1 Tax=Lentinula aff. detonsa TaxID=2804958 RepID=A0AA38NI88_9AGAR|nr:hypothetical protein GGU10DRAFT_361384 [Lentinula aff. detonsa]
MDIFQRMEQFWILTFFANVVSLALIVGNANGRYKSMKSTVGLSILAVFATAALGNIIPRDFAALQNDVQIVTKNCFALKNTIEQVKAPLSSTILLNLIAGSNNLSAALNVFASDAEIAGVITSAQALTLLASIGESIDDCIIPALNELTADAALLIVFKPEIEANLKKLQISYLSCANNLISACPSAQKAEASQVAAKPNAALAASLKAYA